MKCTNRFFKASALLLISCVICLTGCSDKQLPMDFKQYNDISAAQSDSKAKGFADTLAVTDVNVSAKGGFESEDASAAGLFDVNNAQVLYAHNIHEQMNPASLTKIMTAICAIKYGNPEDIIICSENVNKLESGASTCGLKPGDRLTLEQALKLMLLPSANDAAIAVAEHVSGSVEDFAALMNEEAHSLGATNTNFVNPHGLTADGHYTTAYDMYLIVNEARKYDMFNEMIALPEYSTFVTSQGGEEKEITVKTSNKFLDGSYAPPERVTVIGGKTGTTAAAGSCLILIAQDTSGNPYIAVILKASERSVLYDEMIKLLDEINSR